jgi:zinc transport system ATP-binding protein
MPAEIVSVEDLTYEYDSSRSLDHVSFKVNEGDFLGLVGPNGAGKTTLFRCMLNILKDYRGTIRLFGHDIRNNKYVLKKVGYIPQKKVFEQSFPATVSEIVSLGQLGRRPDKNKILSAVNDAGLLDQSNIRIDELSGGQLQRVLIAKALASDATLLILDEPTTSIDTEAENNFYALLTRLNKERKITIIWSSHDLDAIKKLANKVACINKKLFFHGNVADFFGDDKLMISAYLESSMQEHMHSHFNNQNGVLNSNDH